METIVNRVLELVVVEATLCLVLASFFFERTTTHRRSIGWIFVILAAASVGNYFNLGEFKGMGNHLHKAEQYHFFFGSKYLEELSYDGLYEASILAGREEGLLKDGAIRYRDLTSFEFRQGLPRRERQAELRSRFTHERWIQFRHDLRFFFAGAKGRPGGYVTDHGNTGSPAWAMLAGLFTRNLPLNPVSAHLFAYLDVLLLLVLFWTAFGAFGERGLTLAVIVGLSVPLVYDFLGGSILRMDWLVVLGMSICFFEKRRFRMAGILLGYAVAAKVFAAVMVLPLALRFLAMMIRDRRPDPDQRRYFLFAAIGLALFILLPMLYFGKPGLWQDYFQRLLLTFHEGYYPRNHSFRDLFLQILHYPWSFWNPLPGVVAARVPDIVIGDVRVAFTIAQAALLGGLCFVAFRNPARSAFALGPLAVFVLLVTNRYYWQMWMISALALAPTYRRDWRHAAFLSGMLAWLCIQHIVEMSSLGRWKGGYLGSFALFWILASLIGFEIASWYRQRRTAGCHPSSRVT